MAVAAFQSGSSSTPSTTIGDVDRETIACADASGSPRCDSANCNSLLHLAATGELEASQELSEAADRMNESPGALQLRTLQTLAEVATERNSTLVFPIPVEMLAAFKNAGTK